MMPPSARRFLSPLLAVLLLAAGCQSDSKAPPPSDYTRETGNEQIPVQDKWRKFALSHYAGELLVELPNATNVRFLQPATVTANRNVKTGRVQLVVLGELDQTNRQGNRLRHGFFVGWIQSGGGWKLVDRQIDAGAPAPPPPKPFEAPPSPTTPPTAPVDAIPAP